MASFMANPQNRDTERAFGLQKYLILHHEQDSLRRRLSTSSSGSLSRYSSRSSSTDSESPVDSYSSVPAPPQSSPVTYFRSGSPDWDLPPLHEAEEDSWKQLMNVNYQIKTTLTTLLNCESVKHDPQFRLWVSTRLMDAEMELKQQRRQSVHGGSLLRKNSN